MRDAIAYGRPDATDAEVEAAARAVGAHEVVAGLPEGYRTRIGERGRSLSAGQRQLLALARAELVDPDVLLFDEATASLDLATEAAVTRAADALSRRRTTLVVAHRLTTAARADRIVVLAGAGSPRSAGTTSCSPPTAPTPGCGRPSPPAGTPTRWSTGPERSAVPEGRHDPVPVHRSGRSQLLVACNTPSSNHQVAAGASAPAAERPEVRPPG